MISAMLVLAFLAACCAVLMLSPEAFLRLWRDTRGTLAEVALADRGTGSACNMPRLPKNRFPVYSTTIEGTANGSGVATLSFKAERDTLFIGMSVTPETEGDEPTARVFMSYCNTKYLVNAAAAIWQRCCDRKPIFLMGVKENKEMQFTVTGLTATTGKVKITLHGFQGNGCCG